jgi:hypothetical protein
MNTTSKNPTTLTGVLATLLISLRAGCPFFRKSMKIFLLKKRDKMKAIMNYELRITSSN